METDQTYPGALDIVPDQTLILDKPPCCLEFWPVDPEYFVIGTYNLVATSGDGVANSSTPVSSMQDSSRQSMETAHSRLPSSETSSKGAYEQRRDGSLILLRLNGNTMQELETTQTASAVLDIRFSPHDPSILAAATSNGTVILYSLEVHAGPSPRAGTHLSHPVVLTLFDDETIVTSVVWDPEDENRLAVTTSTGDVVLVSLSPLFYDLQSGRKALYEETQSTQNPHQELDLQMVHRHELEAWIISWNPSIESISTAGPGVLSGGDDGVLRYSPIEPLIPTLSGAGKSKTAFPTGTVMTTPWFDRRMHGAGVTAILPLTIKTPLPRRTDDAALDEDPEMTTIPEEADEEILTMFLTGSYDDHLRVLSCPSHTKRVELDDSLVTPASTTTNFSRPGAGNANGDSPQRKSVSFAAGTGIPGTDKPKLLHELAMPGGVWRIKLLSTDIDMQHHGHEEHNLGQGLGHGPPQPLNNNPVHPALRTVASPKAAMTVTVKVLVAVACMYSGAYVVELEFETKFFSSPPSSSTSLARSKLPARKSLDYNSNRESIDQLLGSAPLQARRAQSGQSIGYVRREEQWSSRIVASMSEHKSICYGIDAQPLPILNVPSLAGLNPNGSTSNPASPTSATSARRSTSSLPSPPSLALGPGSTSASELAFASPSGTAKTPTALPSLTSNARAVPPVAEDRGVAPARIAAATAAANPASVPSRLEPEARSNATRVSASSALSYGDGEREDLSVSSIESSRYATAYNSILNSNSPSVSGSESNSNYESERPISGPGSRYSPLRSIIGGTVAAERAARLAAGVQAQHITTEPITPATALNSSLPDTTTSQFHAQNASTFAAAHGSVVEQIPSGANTTDPFATLDSTMTSTSMQPNPKSLKRKSRSRFSRIFSSSSSGTTTSTTSPASSSTEPCASGAQEQLPIRERERELQRGQVPAGEALPTPLSTPVPLASPGGELAPIPVSTEYPDLAQQDMPFGDGAQSLLPTQSPYEHLPPSQTTSASLTPAAAAAAPLAPDMAAAKGIRRKRLKRRVLTCSFYDRRVCLWRF